MYVPSTAKYLNRTPKDAYLPIPKLNTHSYSILAVANYLCSYVQVNSTRLKQNLASKWATKHLWGYHLFCC